MYSIAAGAHSATVASGTYRTAPRSGLATVSRRNFRLAFNTTAIYELTHPTQPDDQLDWNKLPGLSDCGTFDLATFGAMFAWRWRTDLSPQVLEVTAYWNRDGVHEWASEPLFTLSRADLEAVTPLKYSVAITSTAYTFTVQGHVRGRAISASTTGPRGCTGPTDSLKWLSGLYFGGTSVAPQIVTAPISEP